VQPGSGDLCFITETPIEEVLAAWKEAGIEVGGLANLIPRATVVHHLFVVVKPFSMLTDSFDLFAYRFSRARKLLIVRARLESCGAFIAVM